MAACRASSSILTPNAKPLDFMTYARVLWRRKWIFLAVVVILPVAVYEASLRSAKLYQSSVLLQVQPTSVDTAQGTSTGGASAQFIAIAARLIQTTGVAQGARRQLHVRPRPTASQLLSAISVTTDPSTGFITITTQANQAKQAARIANAFGAAVNSARAREAVKQIDQGISGLTAQISALPHSAFVVRDQLVVQLERLRAQRTAQGANAQIIEPAVAHPTPISPHPVRNALLGLVVALLLAFGLIALAEALDQRVRNQEDLEELTKLPLLAAVPRTAFRQMQTTESIEAFRRLRANLSFFNVDRDLSSIVIASGHTADGKTMVAMNLAHAYAYSGNDVVLIDADLRRPRIAERLQIEPGLGLAGVLSGQAEVDEALVDIGVRSSGPGRVLVLPAGELPPNPTELLASQRMHRLIEEFSTVYDVVILDTSPLMAVSDALPLLDEAAGVLLIARLGVIRRNDIRYLRRILDGAQGSALGVVATGLRLKRSARSYADAYYVKATAADSVNGDGTEKGKKRTVLSAVGRRRH